MPRRPCSQEPGTEPTAEDQDQGGAQCTSVHPAHSMTRGASKLPRVTVEVEEKDKNIPALGNIAFEAISGEFVPTKAQGASGRCSAARGSTGVVVVK